MSWGIEIVGTRKAVRRDVSAYFGKLLEKEPDSTEYGTAKTLTLAAIDKAGDFPSGYRESDGWGLYVSSTGHMGVGGAGAQVSVRSVRLTVDVVDLIPPPPPVLR